MTLTPRGKSAAERTREKKKRQVSPAPFTRALLHTFCSSVINARSAPTFLIAAAAFERKRVLTSFLLHTLTIQGARRSERSGVRASFKVELTPLGGARLFTQEKSFWPHNNHRHQNTAQKDHSLLFGKKKHLFYFSDVTHRERSAAHEMGGDEEVTGQHVPMSPGRRTALFTLASLHVVLCSGTAYGWTAIRLVFKNAGVFAASSELDQSRKVSKNSGK